MTSTTTEVSNYISSIRVGIAYYVDKVCTRERLGNTNTFCNRQKVILVSAYLDCIIDYFTPFIERGVDDGSYTTNNFFTIEKIRDCMQHVNTICGTFYMIEL